VTLFMPRGIVGWAQVLRQGKREAPSAAAVGSQRA
jgi:hypothetical protein